ncbi:MAG: ABC transporter ATP-binding protein [Candidatus Obscuribacterales bacterium]|nr:ABC transporter ATP-binding protein [Candidatus Obscuribacterales bacterium]
MTDTDNVVLQLEELSAGFSQKAVVEGVSVTIRRGSIAAIAGGNGAGKSTLLKTIARLLGPIRGTILFEGKDLHSVPLPALAKKLAYVPQDIANSRDLTVENMIALGRNPHQKWWQWRTDHNDKEAIENAIKSTELADLREKSIAEISGGERQRTAIAMSLAQQPEILLLDEPTAHLDFKHQKSLMQLLLKLKSEGMTIITCLHDLNFISQVCDQVICLKKAPKGPSSQLFAGAPREVLTGENLQSAFDTQLRIIRDSSDPDSSSIYFGL